MPFRIPVYRQSFRVYDPARARPNPLIDAAFHLVVAAPEEPALVEHALAHLLFVHTDVGIDWVDVMDAADARAAPAYGLAHVIRGAAGHDGALAAAKSGLVEEGRSGAFLFVQLVSWEDRAAYGLAELDSITTRLFPDDDAAIVYTSTDSARESHAVLIGFRGAVRKDI